MTNFFTHKFRKKSPIEILAIIIFGGIFITGIIILFGYLVMWLWNWLMPQIFGLPTLTYWQAVGLFFLLKILLGGCNFGNKNKSHKDTDNKCEKDSKTDFSKWKHYDKFWKEEGDEYYKQYVNKQADDDQNSTVENI